MTSGSGVSANVNVPADQPAYDATDEGPVGKWDSLDDRAGTCEPGSFENPTDFPSTGAWKQT